MTRAADPRIGSDLGPYRIEAVIGRGGMGVVYRAEQVELGRGRWRSRCWHPTLVDEEAFRQRFVRESQMAAAIDHPNILPIYEAGEVEGGLLPRHALRRGHRPGEAGFAFGHPGAAREVIQLLAPGGVRPGRRR